MPLPTTLGRRTRIQKVSQWAARKLGTARSTNRQQKLGRALERTETSVRSAYPDCRFCLHPLSSMSDVCFVSCCFDIHATHVQCLLRSMRDPYTCTVCRDTKLPVNPAQQSEKVRTMLLPHVYHEYLRAQGIEPDQPQGEPICSLTLVSAGISEYDTFVERWMDSTGLWFDRMLYLKAGQPAGSHDDDTITVLKVPPISLSSKPVVPTAAPPPLVNPKVQMTDFECTNSFKTKAALKSEYYTTGQGFERSTKSSPIPSGVVSSLAQGAPIDPRLFESTSNSDTAPNSTLDVNFNFTNFDFNTLEHLDFTDMLNAPLDTDLLIHQATPEAQAPRPQRSLDLRSILSFSDDDDVSESQQARLIMPLTANSCRKSSRTRSQINYREEDSEEDCDWEEEDEDELSSAESDPGDDFSIPPDSPAVSPKTVPCRRSPRQGSGRHTNGD